MWWLVLARGLLPAWKGCLCAQPSHPETLEPAAAQKHQQAGDPPSGQCHHKPTEEDGQGLPQPQQANAIGGILFSPPDFFQQNQTLTGLVGINFSWGTPRQHCPKRGGGSGGNAPAVWFHHVFSIPEGSHAGSWMGAPACRWPVMSWSGGTAHIKPKQGVGGGGQLYPQSSGMAHKDLLERSTIIGLFWGGDRECQGGSNQTCRQWSCLWQQQECPGGTKTMMKWQAPWGKRISISAGVQICISSHGEGGQTGNCSKTKNLCS